MKKVKGIGLLELMLALAIISVLLVAATRYFSSTDSSRKVNDAVSMLQAVITASEDIRTSENNYGSITNIKYLQDRGLVQEGLTNPWGGKIDVIGKGHVSYISLSLTNLPNHDCKALIDIMAKKGVTDGKCDESEYTGNYSS